MENPENPQAFPRLHKWRADNRGAACNTGYEAEEYSQGMTLLDYFAGQIAQGMAAYSGTIGTPFGPSEIATRSYQVAAALIANRAEINRQLQEK